MGGRERREGRGREGGEGSGGREGRGGKEGSEGCGGEEGGRKKGGKISEHWCPEYAAVSLETRTEAGRQRHMTLVLRTSLSLVSVYDYKETDTTDQLYVCVPE